MVAVEDKLNFHIHLNVRNITYQIIALSRGSTVC